MNRLRFLWAGLLVAMMVSAQAGATIAPDALVKQTSEKLLSELTSNRQALQADQQRLYRLVDEVVLPHFDFERMSQLVLAQYWRRATDAQRQRFAEEFKALLVRTYATALFEYTGQEIVYKPFRLKQGETTAVVKTEVLQRDGPKIPMDYLLKLGNSGAWKVFDIRIDGISLVTNYRTSYARHIQNSGLDSLITSLAEKSEKISKQ